ncbi:MAG TPA: valine--tRNA ligase [Candidatus Acidoferrales bacterium]|nr:valine--tRNA ligase [Candidatus Acidoferrales bacterium]
MPSDIPKAYEPQEIERRWAQAWFDEKLYRAEAQTPGTVFSIVLPPPNVTGSIHIGHMLEHTQIDILVRWRRMRGFKTLWLPGIDHAGIATQVVVERQLAKEGLKREQMGRDEFERRVWQWKAESGGNIKKQMIRLGVSCDWTRERFTLDPPLYRAVMEAFLRLYHEGLIYRGRYMVNWCPRCQTALSDLETVHETREGKLWYIRYAVAGSDESITVATTRPETMLGDTAVAVHPEDERYKRLIGKKVILPLMNREIPVIADEFVDREFGTGAVKVTPAHDPNDFALGQRHKLAEIDVMTPDGHMSAAAGPYAGMDRFAARERIVEDLRAKGLLERVTNHQLSVGICDRCKTIIEPRLSMQWFCKMKPLAEPAVQSVQQGVLSIVPDNQKKIFLDWLTNIRDWCISRQLWWGHRIPIWHCGNCGAMTPAPDSRVEVVDGHAQIASVPQKCSKCGSAKLTQDPDVLDTWFSSGLWPMSTLGWPDDTEDLRTFYPTSLLISGYDILFFWDARMVMLGLHLMPRPKIEERIPFSTLHVHGLVRDPHGMKMSKTRGNVVDPLEIIEKHGTDALRFALAVMAAPGTDIALSEERILGYRAFANKLWNAARFLFFNLEKIEAMGVRLEELAAPEIRAKAPYPTHNALAHQWIFSRLAATTAQVNDALENFRFHEAAHVIYHFFWGDFCDWYIEWLKPQLAAEDREEAIATWRNLFATFEYALRLLHPFMPFITEELWHRLPQAAQARSISLETFPEASVAWPNATAEEQMAELQEIIVAARNIRAEMKVEPRQKVPAEYGAENPLRRQLLEASLEPITRLAGLSALHISKSRLTGGGTAMRSGAEWDLRLAANASVDQQREIERLRKEIDVLAKAIQSNDDLLKNEGFLSRAPQHVLENTRAKMAERQLEHQKLVNRLAELEKSDRAAS